MSSNNTKINLKRTLNIIDKALYDSVHRIMDSKLLFGVGDVFPPQYKNAIEELTTYIMQRAKIIVDEYRDKFVD